MAAIAKISLRILFFWWMAVVSLSAAETGLFVSFDKTTGRLSVDADNARLSDVMARIGESAGCKIVLTHKDIQERRITLNFSDHTLEQGMFVLTRNFSLALVYKAEDLDKKKGQQQQVREIWLFQNEAKLFSKQKREARLEKDRDLTGGTDMNRASPNLLQDPAGKLAQTTIEDENLASWISKLLESNSPDDQRQAVTELQKIGGEEAVSFIAGVLGHEDANLRHHAVESLKFIESRRSLQLIAQALLGDPDAGIRESALAYFIDRIDDPVALAFVRTALKDKSGKIRSQAQKALEFY